MMCVEGKMSMILDAADSIDCDNPYFFERLTKEVDVRSNSIKKAFDYLDSSNVCQHRIEINADYNLLSPLVDLALDLLEGKHLTGWHATRLIDPDEVRRRGLRAYAPQETRSRLKELFLDIGMPLGEADRRSLWAEERVSRKEAVARRNCINFYSAQQLESEYALFAENIGGEIARHALQGADGKYLQRLSSRGTPLEVKFSYAFSCLDSQNQERAASSFVKVEIARLLRGASESEPVEFDGWVRGDVPPEHILEIQILENVPARSNSN